MSARIRENTEKYRDTCRTFLAYQEAEKMASPKVTKGNSGQCSLLWIQDHAYLRTG